ncbi:monocyte chemotactic protein 1B-like [Clinocottus analis]|uniref:monocyte chemotactic protein 1B-like n=1 Tax=Clinocottus analis TaxID=304258 RepID=UPI0035C11B24
MAAARLALTLLVLMLAAAAVTEGLRGAGPKRCCFRFHEKAVPRGQVLGYIRTSQRCSKPAVLLKTVAGRSLCARPSAAWVQELIGQLDTAVPGETSNL